MLEVKNIAYYYKRKGFRIHDVNLKLEEGYFAVLLGNNGAGKTTLLRTIYKMYQPKRGEILWNGEKITNRNLHQYRREAAYIEDGNWCMEWQTVLENVEMLKDIYDTFNKTAFYEYLKAFDFGENLMNKKYEDLSKGEQMKFQVAFVLARHPKLVIMDEPFPNLDPVVKTDLIEVLHQNVMNHEMSVLLSTHLVEDITDLTDYIGIMDEGKMKAFGDREEILSLYHSDNLREILRQHAAD